jgi:hypothetical protein
MRSAINRACIAFVGIIGAFVPARGRIRQATDLFESLFWLLHECSPNHCRSPDDFVLAGSRVLIRSRDMLCSLHDCVRCSGSPCWERSLQEKLQSTPRDHRRFRPGKGRIRQATDSVLFLLGC